MLKAKRGTRGSQLVLGGAGKGAPSGATERGAMEDTGRSVKGLRIRESSQVVGKEERVASGKVRKEDRDQAEVREESLGETAKGREMMAIATGGETEAGGIAGAGIEIGGPDGEGGSAAATAAGIRGQGVYEGRRRRRWRRRQRRRRRRS